MVVKVGDVVEFYDGQHFYNLCFVRAVNWDDHIDLIYWDDLREVFVPAKNICHVGCATAEVFWRVATDV